MPIRAFLHGYEGSSIHLQMDMIWTETPRSLLTQLAAYYCAPFLGGLERMVLHSLFPPTWAVSSPGHAPTGYGDPEFGNGDRSFLPTNSTRLFGANLRD